MASRSWNRVEIIGNLTRDPEMRYTPQGTAVATFSLATNRVYNTPDGERKEEVDFHRCVAWGKLAELCSQLLKKGNRTFISGRLQNREWEGQDGQKRNTTEIVVEDMILLTSRSGGYGDNMEDVTPQSGGGAAPRNNPPAPKRDLPDSKQEKVEAPVPQETAKEELKPEDLEDLPF